MSPRPKTFDFLSGALKPSCHADVVRCRRRSWSRYFVSIQTLTTRQWSASEMTSTVTYHEHSLYRDQSAYEHKMCSTSSTVGLGRYRAYSLYTEWAISYHVPSYSVHMCCCPWSQKCSERSFLVNSSLITSMF